MPNTSQRPHRKPMPTERRATWTPILPASLALGLIAGCASPKALTQLQPHQRPSQVLVAQSPTASSRPDYSTVTGRSARQTGSGGGLLGSLVGSAVAAGSESGGREFVTLIHHQSGIDEARMIQKAIHQWLQTSEVDLTPIPAKTAPSTSSSQSPPRFLWELDQFGLREVQHGFFAPFAQVSARLVNQTDRSLWKARVQSVGSKPRRRQEFETHPPLYGEDFAEVADDLARQLIQGPVRPIEQ